MYLMVAATLLIVYLLPRITKIVPSPLVAIVIMTIVAMSTKLNVRRVGDIGNITGTLPSFHLPHVVARDKKLDKHVIIVGMNQESQSFMSQLGSEEFVN
jgi:sulfate permease, SulP family